MSTKRAYSNKIIITWGILLGCALIVSLYKFPDSLDIIRYYQDAQNAAKSYETVFEYIQDRAITDVDFIYSSTLYLFSKYGIPLNIATYLFFISYFFGAIYVCKRKYGDIVFHYAFILLVVLFCTPIDWILTISRTTAAISIFYFAIQKFQNKEPVKGVILCIMSALTHFMMSVFVVILLVVYLLSFTHINNIFLRLALLGFIILGFYPSLFSDDVSRAFALLGGGTDLRYGEVYSEFIKNTDSILAASRIDIGSKLGALFVYIISVYCCIVDNNRDFLYWMLYILTLMLAFFFNSSAMMVNRIEMLLPAFIGASFFSIFFAEKNKGLHSSIVYLLSLTSVIIFMLVIYSARAVFF